MRADLLDWAVQRLHSETGNVINEERRALAEARLDMLANQLRRPDADALVVEAMGDPTLTQRLLESLLNSETLFFRDVRVFRTLSENIVPTLVGSANGRRRLRVWSAACATGQEPYSVAMALLDCKELWGWSVSILATDVSAERVQRAERGRYTQLEVNRGLPARKLVRYFHQESDGDWSVLPELRSRVQFETLNLMNPWPLREPVDILLMRNVLIYLDAATRSKLLGRVRSALADDGYLILGASETADAVHAGFDPADVAVSGIYRKR